MTHCKGVLSIGVVVCVGASLLLAGCGTKEEVKEVVRPVKSVVVGGTEDYVRNFPGKVQGVQRVELSFRQVSGPLVELPVKEGDEVEEGALLAKMDPRDYRITYTEAKAEYDKAESDYKRYVALYEEDAVPLADLELQRARRDVARSKLDDATAALTDTELTAPFKGVIGKRFVENFEKVQPMQPIVSLDDISKVEVVIDLPEALVARMDADDDGPELYATFETAPGKEYPLKLKEFATRADPTTQTYRATLIMDQPAEITVLPGMTATVRTRMKPGAERKEPVISVPSAAVFDGEDGKSYVWVVDPETRTVHARQVEAGGLFGESSIRILSGIAKGDRVVTAGANTLREGMKVRLIDQTQTKIVE